MAVRTSLIIFFPRLVCKKKLRQASQGFLFFYLLLLIAAKLFATLRFFQFSSVAWTLFFAHQPSRSVSGGRPFEQPGADLLNEGLIERKETTERDWIK